MPARCKRWRVAPHDLGEHYARLEDCVGANGVCGCCRNACCRPWLFELACASATVSLIRGLMFCDWLVLAYSWELFGVIVAAYCNAYIAKSHHHGSSMAYSAKMGPRRWVTRNSSSSYGVLLLQEAVRRPHKSAPPLGSYAEIPGM